MPVPFIPIALMIGSMIAQRQAQNQVENEREKRMNEERQRQRVLGEQADARMRDELEKQSRPAVEQEQQQQAQQRQTSYDKVAPSVDATTASYLTGASMPTEVKSDLASHITNAIRRGRATSAAQAKLGGTADADLRGKYDLARGQQDLNAIGNKSRASSAILPYELQDANRAGEGWRTVGDIANIAGMGYGLYSMTTPPGNAAYASSLKNPLFAH